MITKGDIVVSLVVSTSFLGVSIGVIGVKNIFVSTLFFIVSFILILILFFIFRPKTPKPFYDKKWDY